MNSVLPKGWEGAVEVQPLYPPLPSKMCEAEGCTEMFTPKWKTERRCDDCRDAGMPYREQERPKPSCIVFGKIDEINHDNSPDQLPF